MIAGRLHQRGGPVDRSDGRQALGLRAAVGSAQAWQKQEMEKALQVDLQEAVAAVAAELSATVVGVWEAMHLHPAPVSSTITALHRLPAPNAGVD